MPAQVVARFGQLIGPADLLGEVLLVDQEQLEPLHLVGGGRDVVAPADGSGLVVRDGRLDLFAVCILRQIGLPACHDFELLDLVCPGPRHARIGCAEVDADDDDVRVLPPQGGGFLVVWAVWELKRLVRTHC
jgi:hypothetical protein